MTNTYTAGAKLSYISHIICLFDLGPSPLRFRREGLSELRGCNRPAGNEQSSDRGIRFCHPCWNGSAGFRDIHPRLKSHLRKAYRLARNLLYCLRIPGSPLESEDDSGRFHSSSSKPIAAMPTGVQPILFSD